MALTNQPDPKEKTLKAKHWSELPEKGTYIGIKFFVWVYKFLGRGISELILFPVMAYFFITSAKSRNASLKYLVRVREFGSKHKRLYNKPTWMTVFLHFMEFGRSLLDKMSSWTGDISEEDIIFENRRQLVELAKEGRGGVIIGSHLGNLEVIRALVTEVKEVRVNVLVFTRHALKFNSVISKINPNATEKIIHVETIGPDTAIFLKEKIDRGEFISIVGDRTAIKSDKHVSFVDFLGQKAPFTQGPLILAKLFECPVYLLFCLKTASGFKVYFEHFIEKVKATRKTRQLDFQVILQRYARKLEELCLLEPFQWFNFFDFWEYNKSESLLDENKRE